MRWFTPLARLLLICVTFCAVTTYDSSAKACMVRELPFTFLINEGAYKVRISKTGTDVLRVGQSGEQLLYTLQLQNNLDVIYLSQDGRAAVVVESGLLQNAPQPDSVGLEFFIDGKLVKSYRVLELVPDPDRLNYNDCGYNWVAFGSAHYVGISLDGQAATLVTADNRYYVFSTQSGAILAQGPDREFLKQFLGVYSRMEEETQRQFFLSAAAALLLILSGLSGLYFSTVKDDVAQRESALIICITSLIAGDLCLVLLSFWKDIERAYLGIAGDSALTIIVLALIAGFVFARYAFMHLGRTMRLSVGALLVLCTFALLIFIGLPLSKLYYQTLV